MADFDIVSEHLCYGGRQLFCQHMSRETRLPMRFSVYLPPQAGACAKAGTKLPALVYLAGLTCTEETFPTKAGAQRLAAELGLALIAPDTSPRSAGIAGESASWDFGVGAGFYLDATQAPWATHWRMESWLMQELLPMVSNDLPIHGGRLGLLGHSMGGHGALTLGLRHPGRFRSISAIAPICAPTQCPWGQKAFAGYLGKNIKTWEDHDATQLMRRQTLLPYPGGILIDQGMADKFLDEQLHPHLFVDACDAVGQPLTLRQHPGYDHGYYFIASVIDDHLRFHAQGLNPT